MPVWCVESYFSALVGMSRLVKVKFVQSIEGVYHVFLVYSYFVYLITLKRTSTATMRMTAAACSAASTSAAAFFDFAFGDGSAEEAVVLI